MIGLGHRVWPAATLLTGAIVIMAGCSAESSVSEPIPSVTKSNISPLEDVLGFDIGPIPTYLPEFQARLDEVENLIAQCMHEQGFDYTPWPEPLVATNLDVDPTIPDGEWGSLSYRQRYGFGITTNPPVDESATPTPENPNKLAVSSMTWPQREAWELAYWGTSRGNPVETITSEGETVYRMDWRQSGCRGAAEHEIFLQLPARIYDDPRFEPMWNHLSRLSQSYHTSAEYAAIYADWSACMKAAGYDGLTGSADAHTFAGQLADSPEAADLTTAQIQQVEIDVAVTDYECAISQRVNERYKELRYSAEEEFLEEHGDEIELLLLEIEATPYAEPTSTSPTP